MISLPSWDLFITLFFIIGISYGFILQREKIIGTLVSVYISLVIVSVWSETIHKFFMGEKAVFNQVFIRSSASPFTIQVILFAAIILLLSAKSGISGAKSTKGLLSPLELLIYSFLTTALILSSIFYFLPAETRAAFAETSRLARLVINYHTWWILLPIVFLVVTGFKRGGESE